MGATSRMNIGRRLLYMFAGAGISHIMGIPFVGSIIARLLDGVAWGSEQSAEAVRYFYSLDEANDSMAAQLPQGARVQQMWTDRETGQVGIKYDTSAYTGQNIEDDTFIALEDDWL